MSAVERGGFEITCLKCGRLADGLEIRARNVVHFHHRAFLDFDKERPARTCRVRARTTEHPDPHAMYGRRWTFKRIRARRAAA